MKKNQKMSQKQKDVLSTKLKGRKAWNKDKKGIYSSETKKAMGAKNIGKQNYWKGRKRPQITRDRMSSSAQKHPSNHLGKKQSAEAKKLASLAKLINYQDPKFLKKMEYKNQRVRETMKDKPKSEEQKAKMSNAKLDHEVTQETRDAISHSRKEFYNTHPEAREAAREWRKTVSIPTRDSKIEKKMQSQLTEQGIRHKKHKSIDLFFSEEEKAVSPVKLPGFTQPDILLEPHDKYYKGLLIFADGCAVHACPVHLGRMSNIRLDDKLRRHWDLAVTRQLFKQGYYVIRLWEHDIEKREFNIVEHLKEIMPLEHLKGE